MLLTTAEERLFQCLTYGANRVLSFMVGVYSSWPQLGAETKIRNKARDALTLQPYEKSFHDPF